MKSSQIFSDHQKIPINSYDLKTVQHEQLTTLKHLHDFILQSDQKYSIYAGTLIGSFWNDSLIPWDDDIDLLMNKKSLIECFKPLWDSGFYKETFLDFKNPRNKGKPMIHSKNLRIVKILNHTYEMVKIADWKLLKFKPYGIKAKTNKILKKYGAIGYGGLDVVSYEMQNGKPIENWIKNRECFQINEDTEIDTIKLNQIDCLRINRSEGEKYLDNIYGKKWRIKLHPDFK